MRLVLLLLLIPATWVPAFKLAPWAGRRGGWALLAIHTMGCSGSFAALVLS
jgi:hypothetical protein